MTFKLITTPVEFIRAGEELMKASHPPERPKPPEVYRYDGSTFDKCLFAAMLLVPVVAVIMAALAMVLLK